MKQLEKEYCVYFHINPIKQEIFYVGIGDEKRPYEKTNRNNWWNKYVNKYKNYDIQIIKNNLSWAMACNLERYYIKLIGRRDLNNGTLVNLTSGGQGTIGRIVSDETRKKLSESNGGKKCYLYGMHLSDETKNKISEKLKGEKNPMYDKKHTDKARKKISESRKGCLPNSGSFKPGHIISIETRNKMSIAKQNMSDETKLKMSIAKKGEKHHMFGKHHTEETRQKLSKTHKGKKLSEEHKQNIGKGHKGLKYEK